MKVSATIATFIAYFRKLGLFHPSSRDWYALIRKAILPVQLRPSRLFTHQLSPHLPGLSAMERSVDEAVCAGSIFSFSNYKNRNEDNEDSSATLNNLQTHNLGVLVIYSEGACENNS